MFLGLRIEGSRMHAERESAVPDAVVVAQYPRKIELDQTELLSPLIGSSGPFSRFLMI